MDTGGKRGNGEAVCKHQQFEFPFTADRSVVHLFPHETSSMRFVVCDDPVQCPVGATGLPAVKGPVGGKGLPGFGGTGGGFEMRTIAIDVPGVCQSCGFMQLCCANTAERIEVLPVVETFGDLRNLLSDGSLGFVCRFNAAITNYYDYWLAYFYHAN